MSTKKPKRIQLRRTKGWRMPPNTVKVDRSTKFGNPFKVGSVQYVAGHGRIKIASVGHSVAMYRHHVNDLVASAVFRETVRDELRGKNLGCWCPVGSPCHADVLLEIANVGENR